MIFKRLQEIGQLLFDRVSLDNLSLSSLVLDGPNGEPRSDWPWKPVHATVPIGSIDRTPKPFRQVGTMCFVWPVPRMSSHALLRKPRDQTIGMLTDKFLIRDRAKLPTMLQYKTCYSMVVERIYVHTGEKS